MPKKVYQEKRASVQPPIEQPHAFLFWVCVSTLVVVPLVFSTAVYRTYVLPKLAVLLVGATAILAMTVTSTVGRSPGNLAKAFKSRHVLLVSMYVTAMAVATVLGVAPLASLFGSSTVEMGLLTRLCFFVVFIGLIAAVGNSREPVIVLLWAMALTGLAAAAYACLQFFGYDPFLSAGSYTFASSTDAVLRVPGTLGHSNYLGNFLLYTTPLSAGLALASHGRPRRIALAGVFLSLAAITFSGTRGAWLGAIVGAIAFAVLEMSRGRKTISGGSKRLITGAAVAAGIILAAVLIVGFSPGLQSIKARARSFVAEGFTGAGRTLLWRDSARMVPRYALAGCGPEGFARAFLEYKSEELARFAPQINNESSHNSYLDAAISFGLPGAVFYIAIIASAFALLLKARRRLAERPERLIVSGLASSLAAVVVHNFFIYDQIPTGLYFFALMAVAPMVSNLAEQSEAANAIRPAPRDIQVEKNKLFLPVVIAGSGLLLATTWYAASLARSDIAIKRAFSAANARDWDGLEANGLQAIRSPDPTGANNFLFARALAIYVDRTKRLESAGRDSSPVRARAIDLGIQQGQVALAHTLTPESNYVLLAYLALAAGDTARLREFASAAIRWDPHFSNSRWLMAEALLAEGDRDGAIREAQAAIDLGASSSGPKSVLARARGEGGPTKRKLDSIISRAREMEKKGSADKARELLIRRIRRSKGRCPVCHRELALSFERANRNSEAIAEWEAFERQDPQKAAEEQVGLRIAKLKQR
jgi:O-antigen ligase/tetratricopeptide (TPR) repeat protein